MGSTHQARRLWTLWCLRALLPTGIQRDPSPGALPNHQCPGEATHRVKVLNCAFHERLTIWGASTQLRCQDGFVVVCIHMLFGRREHGEGVHMSDLQLSTSSNSSGLEHQ
jgi:hypothetical protein